MSISLHYNQAASVVRQNLESASLDVGRRSQRLSTGLRINSAGDDAAGLGLSKKISAQVSSSDMAKNNTQTAINMMQTMDADLSVIQNNLQRMRDLGVQASNGVYSANERDMLQTEYLSLWDENSRVVKSSKFADINLFTVTSEAGDGIFFDMNSTDIQVGTNNGSKDRINIGGASAAIESPGLSTAFNAQTTIEWMGYALDSVSSMRANIGAKINRLSATVERTLTRKENIASATSEIVDADIAIEAAALNKSQIRQQASTSLLQQANSMSTIALTLLKQ